MPRTPNPFRPGFGKSPPLLVGRDQELTDFTEALDDGPGAFGRTMLLVGQRGCGKTVMLNALEDAAKAVGWLVVSETASRGLLDRLVTDHLPRLLRDHDPRRVESEITGVSLPGIGGGIDRAVRHRHHPVPSLRSQLADLTDLQARRGCGLLITIDELHRGIRTQGDSRERGEVRNDLEELTTTLQHLVREEREIACVAAGLPGNVKELLTVPNLTFLRRAERFELDRLTPDQAATALHEPILNGGRRITRDALAAAVAAAHGYPFLLQLLGQHMWRADRTAEEITLVHVQEATTKARADMGRLVHDIALDEVSDVDRAYLAAMALDTDRSSTRQIADRLDVTPDYAGVYRRRLIDAELIEERGRGFVGYTLPYFTDHMRTRPEFHALLAGDRGSTLPEPAAPSTPPVHHGDSSGPPHGIFTGPPGSIGGPDARPDEPPPISL